MSRIVAGMTEYLSRLEAAAFLRVHPRTLVDYVHRGLLTRHYPRGARAVRYSLEELRAFTYPVAGRPPRARV